MPRPVGPLPGKDELQGVMWCEWVNGCCAGVAVSQRAVEQDELGSAGLVVNVGYSLHLWSPLQISVMLAVHSCESCSHAGAQKDSCATNTMSIVSEQPSRKKLKASSPSPSRPTDFSMQHSTVCMQGAMSRCEAQDAITKETSTKARAL